MLTWEHAGYMDVWCLHVHLNHETLRQSLHSALGSRVGLQFIRLLVYSPSMLAFSTSLRLQPPFNCTNTRGSGTDRVFGPGPNRIERGNVYDGATFLVQVIPGTR